jgi:hypothetical protein
MRVAWLAIALLSMAVPARAADEKPGAALVAAPSEPTWRTVLLAPGRIVGHGRFDAAAPSYHARRAAKDAEAAAHRTPSCDCPCRGR